MDVAALVEIDESIHEGAMGKDVVSIDAVEVGVTSRVEIGDGFDRNSPALVLFVDIEHMFTLRVEDVSAEGRKDGTAMEEREVVGGKKIVNEVFDNVYSKGTNCGDRVGF